MSLSLTLEVRRLVKVNMNFSFFGTMQVNCPLGQGHGIIEVDLHDLFYSQLPLRWTPSGPAPTVSLSEVSFL